MKRLYLTAEQVSDLLDAICTRRDDCADNAYHYPSEAEDMERAIARLDALERVLIDTEDAPLEPSGPLLLDPDEWVQWGDLCERVDGGAWVEARVWVAVDEEGE